MIHPETIESIREIISGVIARMGIQADIEVREQPDTIVYNIQTADSNMLIGQHGVNLSALQYICRVLAKRKFTDITDIDFVIDVDDYKKKRELYLVSLSEKAYKEAVGNNKAVVLRPMSSYERRLVHSTLSSFGDVATDSIGEEPRRMVTIRPKNYSVDIDPNSLDFGMSDDYIVLE